MGYQRPTLTGLFGFDTLLDKTGAERLLGTNHVSDGRMRRIHS